MKNITKLFVNVFVVFAVLATFNVESFAKTTKALQGDDAIPHRGTSSRAKYVNNNDSESEKLSLRGDDAIRYKRAYKFGNEHTVSTIQLDTGLATTDVVEGDARPFTSEKKRNVMMNIVNRLTSFFIVDVYENVYDNGFPETDPISFQPYKSGKLVNID